LSESVDGLGLHFPCLYPACITGNSDQSKNIAIILELYGNIILEPGSQRIYHFQSVNIPTVGIQCKGLGPIYASVSFWHAVAIRMVGG
jgi:hypothetical protein